MKNILIWTTRELTARDAADVRLRAAEVPSGISGTFCAVVAAEFDQDWAQQLRPDPALAPRAHAARLRLEEHYQVTANDGLREANGEHMRIDEHRIKLFPALLEPMVVGQEGASPAASGVPARPQS